MAVKSTVAKTKKNRRNQAKYPGLEKRFTSRIRQEYLDYDYIDKLSEEEKAWLNNFTEEDLGASFNHKGKRLHKGKKKEKAIYDRNNARNRCVYSRSKAVGSMINHDYNELHELIEGQQDSAQTNYMEDAVIDFIDHKRTPEAIEEHKKIESGEYIKELQELDSPIDNAGKKRKGR